MTRGRGGRGGEEREGGAHFMLDVMRWRRGAYKSILREKHYLYILGERTRGCDLFTLFINPTDKSH